MKANHAKQIIFLRAILLGIGISVGTMVHAATYTYTWQAVDGNWDGNISDAAHWTCDTADRPGAPETTSDKLSIKIPAGVQARITIDKDLSVGSFFSESGSHITLVSVDKADTGELTHLQLSSGLYIRESATLILDRAKITNSGDSVSVQKGGVGIVKNSSSLWCKNVYLNNASATSYWEVSGKATVDVGVLYIGGGNRFVIDDATVRCRNRVGIGTDSSTVTSDSTSLLFRGAEPKLVLYNDGWPDGRDLQVCGEPPCGQMKGDISLVQILLRPVISVSQIGQEDLHQSEGGDTASVFGIDPAIGLPEICLTDIDADSVSRSRKDRGHVAVTRNGSVGKSCGWGFLGGSYDCEYVLFHATIPPLT